MVAELVVFGAAVVARQDLTEMGAAGTLVSDVGEAADVRSPFVFEVTADAAMYARKPLDAMDVKKDAVKPAGAAMYVIEGAADVVLSGLEIMY